MHCDRSLLLFAVCLHGRKMAGGQIIFPPGEAAAMESTFEGTKFGRSLESGVIYYNNSPAFRIIRSYEAWFLVSFNASEFNKESVCCFSPCLKVMQVCMFLNGLILIVHP